MDSGPSSSATDDDRLKPIYRNIWNHQANFYVRYLYTCYPTHILLQGMWSVTVDWVMSCAGYERVE